MQDWMIMTLFWILGLIIGYLICKLFATKSEKKSYDGVISFEDIDEETGVGMFMSLNLDYDQLMQRKELVFEVKNKLSQK